MPRARCRRFRVPACRDGPCFACDLVTVPYTPCWCASSARREAWRGCASPQRGLFRNGWERPLLPDALGRFETAPRPRLPFLDGQRGADRETPNPGGVDLDMSAQREAVRWQAHAV